MSLKNQTTGGAVVERLNEAANTSLSEAVVVAAKSAAQNVTGVKKVASARAACAVPAASTAPNASGVRANGTGRGKASQAANGNGKAAAPAPATPKDKAPLVPSATDITQRLAELETCLTAVEKEIDRMLSTPVKLIADIASHTLGAGGKRLRPALTMLGAQLCGDDPQNPNRRAVTCAAAVELTHTTTLLHDDVVDGAAVRRGKPAANLVWGNETSVLVGDYLFAQVFVSAAQEGFCPVLMLPLATATAEMCAGELIETQSRGDLTMTETQYEEIIRLKTAALIECACRLGPLSVDAPDEAVERYGRYGREIGMAFQIVDDVFDVISTQGRIGKPVGNDIREGDITLPMLRAMQVCSEADKAELQGIVGKEPLSDEEVARALEILRNCDAVEYSLQRARDYVASAKAQLEYFPDSPARDTLLAIADYVLSRDK